MATLAYESVQRLLSEYTFRMENEILNEDLTCIKCKKIMKNAYQSYCGCRYCFECISDYLSEGEKYCVGAKEPCLEEPLQLERNVTVNVALNRRIINVKVRCPNDSCVSVLELVKMEEHLRLCDRRSVVCPYRNIGCDHIKAPKDKIEEHLREYAIEHSKLLIEVVETIKNENSALKEDVNLNKIEIITLKEQSNLKERETEDLKRETEEMKRETEDMKKEIEEMKRETEDLKRETEDMKRETEETKREIEEMKTEMRNKENKITILERESEDNKSIIYKLERDSSEKELKMREMEDNILKVEKENINLKEEVNNIKTKNEEMEENIKHMIVELTEFRKETEEKLNLMKEENEKREIKTVKMEEDNNNIINNNKKEIESLNRDLKSIKETVEIMNKNITNSKKETAEKLKEETEKIEIKSAEMEENIKNMNVESTKFRRETEENLTLIKGENGKREETIKQLKTKIEILNIKTDTAVCVGEIYLIVDKFSERMKESEALLCSRYFYSHSKGYKLLLAVYPGGGRGEGKGSHISVCVYICRGEYDKSLDWPCKYTFSISIINQRTKKDVKSETFNYLTDSPNVYKNRFNKPNNINIVYANYTFMSHGDIEEDLIGGVKVDDCIIIKCFVSVPT